jgi:hypothetical protein
VSASAWRRHFTSSVRPWTYKCLIRIPHSRTSTLGGSHFIINYSYPPRGSDVGLAAQVHDLGPREDSKRPPTLAINRPAAAILLAS